MKSPIVAAIVSAVLTAAVVGGIAIAQTEAGVITACVARQGGNVRIVADGAECRSNETVTVWNQQGPKGESGQAGRAGVVGSLNDLDGTPCTLPSGAIGITHLTFGPGNPAPVAMACEVSTIPPSSDPWQLRQVSPSPATYVAGGDYVVAIGSGTGQVTARLARTGNTSSEADACSAPPAGTLTGKVALIRRGSCPYYTKARFAQEDGAVAVLIYNNIDDLSGLIVTPPEGNPAITVPVMGLHQALGLTLNTQLDSAPVTMFVAVS